MRLNKEDRRKINRYLEQYYNRYMKSAIVDAGDPSNQKYYLGLYVKMLLENFRELSRGIL